MQKIFDNLQLSNTTNLHKYHKNIDIDLLPLRINKSLHGMKDSPHSIFITNSKPLILFFDKNVETEKVFQQCWNFSEAPIIIIENEIDFEIYNGYEFVIKDGHFLLDSLDKNDLDYISIISGKYIEQTSLKKQDNRVDKILLKNIKEAREELIYNLVNGNIQKKRIFNKKNKTYEYKKLSTVEFQEFSEMKNISNSLIGRVIFIRYLIDREVSIGFRKEKEKLSNNDLIVILGKHAESYKLFKYLKSEKGFNGDWFPILKNEENIVNSSHLKILQKLINGYDFQAKQGTLFNFYNFSIIPIEFISNVYESFIGEEEQSKNGAFYTPTFLVDYILKYTIDDYFKNNPKEYNCKVLDPACGSGIFLVEALRKIINQYKVVTGSNPSPEKIKELAKDNIYGLDKDKNAVLISIFSLYLTMLDYQDPKDIEEFLFPYLLKSEKNQEANFFNNDFFDLEAPFNDILLEKNIDFIIGNPPYGRGTIKKKSLADQYISKKKIAIGNEDLVQAFMIRVKDISVQNTKTSFIVTSKVLYNLQSKKFRTNHFFNQFKINHILELSSVMSDIFENAEVPVSILFYEPSSEEEVLKNDFHYISMKPSPYFDKLKILLLSKSDYKKVSQKKLLNYDYLWKILVYGSYLDFNFIKRLKQYSTVNSFIDSKKIGVTVGNKTQDVPKEYLGMPYIQTKQFEPFFIVPNNLVWEEEFVERSRTLDVFKAPSLLISKGISLDLNLKIGILQKDSIFTGTITALKCRSEDTLYGIMGFLNSSFFKYYTMQTASSIGIERPQIHNPEKFSLPYKEDINVIQTSRDIEKHVKETFLTNDKLFNDLTNKLDKHVLDTFDLNKQEYSLIDYSSQIIVPWIMHKNYAAAFRKLSYKSIEIEDYANIFIEHYSNIYQQSNMFFSTEIIYSDYAIGIKFKVLNHEPKNKINWIEEKSIDNFIKLSGSQSVENIFIQKDIKGFEKDGFYVVKPNEYKNWHKAIGYLDFYEFRDAILRTGKKQWKK